MREDLLAKRMFLVGCVGLPWLWAVNVLYFRRKVFGKIRWIDGRDDENDNVTEDNGAAEGLMSGVMGVRSDDEYDDDGSTVAAPNADEIKSETFKWVKRSTYGAATAACLWAAWIIVFQTNKGSFGPGWFVMSEDEGELTGW